MVIKVYISGISGNKEVKKRQQRVLLILDSKNVKYEVIDIAEPGAEEAKDFLQNKATAFGGTISDPSPRHPLPPQIFNDDTYCGDYDMFDMANEIDEMENFLKLEPNDLVKNNTSTAEINLRNGNSTDHEKKVDENETKENEVPNQQVAETKADETEEAKGEEEKDEQNEENGAGDEQTENGEGPEEAEEESKEEASLEKSDD